MKKKFRKNAPSAGRSLPVTPNPELLGMDEAIQRLKTTRPTFYRWLRSGKLKGMKVGRQWRFDRGEIDRFLKGQEPQIALTADIGPLLRGLEERAARTGPQRPAITATNDLEAAVQWMIRLGWQMRASDIHVAPQITTEGARHAGVLRYRVDGVLHVAAEFDARLLPPIVEQWKRLAACDVREKQRPQDGRIVLRFGNLTHDLDLRVNFLPAGFGESITARILDTSATIFRLDRIDYSSRDQEKILHALKSPWGILLATGPTGAGKTTTLYACLSELARPERKVMSVEDPIEAFLPWVVQTQVRPSDGLTFASALRAMLRSDPDVIMLGEIRDREALNIAVQCALTGHLVLSTLHTEDAPGALKRMVEIGLDPFLVGDSTKLVVAQRLPRLLCPHCSVAHPPSAQVFDWASQMARAGGLNWDSLPKDFREPVGCAKCANTGFRGRTVIAEVLEVTPEIGIALRRSADRNELRAIAVGQGMTTMAADGIRRAAEGRTSLAEVRRITL